MVATTSLNNIQQRPGHRTVIQLHPRQHSPAAGLRPYLHRKRKHLIASQSRKGETPASAHCACHPLRHSARNHQREAVCPASGHCDSPYTSQALHPVGMARRRSPKLRRRPDARHEPCAGQREGDVLCRTAGRRKVDYLSRFTDRHGWLPQHGIGGSRQ